MLSIFGKKNRIFSLLLLLFSLAASSLAYADRFNLRSSVDASQLVMNFDDLLDSTRVTNQYPNVLFEHATAISAGVSLNEYNARPHSGSTVIFDDGGPITVTFASPIKSCSAYMAYSHQVTLVGYDEKDNVVSRAKSKLDGNFPATQAIQTEPMEAVRIRSEQGIKRVRITGADSGSSFALDDLTVEWPMVKTRLVLHDHGQSRELKEDDKGVQEIEASLASLWKSTDPGKLLRLIVGNADIDKIKREQTSLEFLFDEVATFETEPYRGIAKPVQLDRLLIPISGSHVQTEGKDQFVTLFFGVRSYGSGPYVATGQGVEGFLNILRKADLLKK
jgi:hypothetical protein